MTSTVGAGEHSKLISLEIRDRAALTGPICLSLSTVVCLSPPKLLFIPYSLLLSLLDAPEKFPTAARAVWRTPAGAQGGARRASGGFHRA